VPALLLTLVFDGIGTRVNMTAYPEGYYQALPWGEFLWRGLTLTNLWTGMTDWVRLGTNGPIWSLSYELGFYLFFGSAVFLTGALRVVIIALLALLVGLPILVMLPAWLLGVWVWTKTDQPYGTDARLISWIMALGSILTLVILKVAGLPQLLTGLTVTALYPQSHHGLLVYSDEVLWNSVIALFTAVHLIGVHRLAAQMPRWPEAALAKSIRWIAGGSFSLYLVHYPTLHLLDATLPETLPAYNLWLLGITLAICFAFAALFERPLKPFRAGAKALWQRVVNPEPSSPTTPL